MNNSILISVEEFRKKSIARRLQPRVTKHYKPKVKSKPDPKLETKSKLFQEAIRLTTRSITPPTRYVRSWTKIHPKNNLPSPSYQKKIFGFENKLYLFSGYDRVDRGYAKSFYFRPEQKDVIWSFD